MQLKHWFSDRTTIVKVKRLFFSIEKIAIDFTGANARFLIRAKIWCTNTCRVCASYKEKSGRRERLMRRVVGEREDKETTYCNRWSKKCLEKEVCLNSWQPCVPWLEYGNSPGVSRVIPSGSSSLGSYGNVRATQWKSHLKPTSAGDTWGRIFLLWSISTWLGSCWQPLTFHLGLCTFAPEDLTSSGYEVGSLTVRESHIW